MTEAWRVAIIGAGRPRNEAGSTGFGMAHAHVNGYAATGRCRLVAVADIVEANASDFAERFGGTARTFIDYEQMLAEVRPDIVSVCTWPHLHARMVVSCARARVRAVHCEKPMAPTWGEAKRMHAACLEANCLLTFNHQRRFLEPFRRARQLQREGAVGDLVRIEGACADMIDWGTHWLDMFNFYNGETPAEWVLGQIDAREERSIFGLPVEGQGLCQVKYANGVRGLLFTGFDSDIGCQNRLIGTEGVIELHNRQPHLRWKGPHGGWVGVETAEGLHGSAAIDRAIADVVSALDTGVASELCSENALRCTEVIFAVYESSRRRGRVDLPLDVDDSALLAMLDAGEIGPSRRVGSR